MSEISVYLQPPLGEQQFLLGIAGLRQILDLERAEIDDRQILEVEYPRIAVPLEPVGDDAVRPELPDVDIRRANDGCGTGRFLKIRLGRDAGEARRHTLLRRAQHDRVGGSAV